MKRGLLSLLTMACLLAAPAAARADVVVHYIDPHPLPPQLHKGMCFIEGPHVHAYQPHKTVLYIKRAGGYTFVGDPVEFEPSGPRHAYHGHHPVFWIDDDPAVAIEHYCYIRGPHYHWQAPPAGVAFKIKSDVAFYVGPKPTWYRARYAHYRPLAAYYVAVHLPRPVVVVHPPVGYVEVNLWGLAPPPPPHVGGGVHVGVGIRVPSVGVFFGGGRRGRRVYRRGGPPYGRAWGHRRHRYYRRGHRGRGHGWGHYKKRKKRKWR
ncbi:MAG: hypothetical protein KC503_00280 [Myxococcales bacterium]|nr:hypothetical protein [Myxococcales bacterium]